MIKQLHRWTRLSSVKWEDAWQERLRFLGEDQIVFVTWPDSRALKIEAYCDAKTGQRLVRQFGGRLTKVSPQIWTGDPARPRAPLAIRNRLKVFSDEPSWRAWQEAEKSPPGIFIPMGMAFGTGEHATTATCLRLFTDVATELPDRWRYIDLGTGSGILAIAAATLGAESVEAVDYDPAAVRIARQNARTNRCRTIQVEEADVLKWKPAARAHVLFANLFSDVLIAAAPRLAKALLRGGRLIFSGVLRKQAGEVAAALEKAGLSAPHITARGKWCAGITTLKRAPRG